MAKLKFDSLTKEEKINTKISFYKTENGKNIKFRLTRLFVIGVFLICFGVILILTPLSKWDIIYAILIFIVALIFILSSIFLRRKKINEYLIKNKK